MHVHLILLAWIPWAAATVLRHRQSDEQAQATVDLTTEIGEPHHLASGLLYGIPDREGAIPDRFLQQSKIHLVRGAGLSIGGCKYDDQANCKTLTTDYKVMRRLGGEYMMLLNDLWAPWEHAPDALPGDGGDWSVFDAFLAAVIDGIKRNRMPDAGLLVDLWNEPDWRLRWDQRQYLEMWNRAYAAFRADDALAAVKLVGPAYATPPAAADADAWWGPFLANANATGHVPDVYDYHLLGLGPAQPTNDPAQNTAAFAALLAQHGLPPDPPVAVTEYGPESDQRPAGAVWWIARLERLGLRGVRAAYQPMGGLHDLLDGLLGCAGVAEGSYRPDDGPGPGDYWPNGEWQVYAYYGTNMTGARVATAAGAADGQVDVYATRGGDGRVRVLAGVRSGVGSYSVAVRGLTAVGLPAAGEAAVQTWAFPFPGGAFGRVDAPTDEGVRAVKYEGDELVLVVDRPDEATAYAFEFDGARPRSGAERTAGPAAVEMGAA